MWKPPALPGGGVPRKSFCFKYRAYRANRAANKKRAMMACFRLHGNLPFADGRAGIQMPVRWDARQNRPLTEPTQAAG
ncbi:MAG: hypothetical protein DBY29_07660 [Coprobacillus sp.]|nr:MAG: hypothetical protein DBY29_07660 [Coprobacillus sp.]